MLWWGQGTERCSTKRWPVSNQYTALNNLYRIQRSIFWLLQGPRPGYPCTGRWQQHDTTCNLWNRYIGVIWSLETKRKVMAWGNAGSTCMHPDQIYEAPPYRSPQITNIDFPVPHQIIEKDFKSESKFGPVVYKGPRWTGKISKAFYEI